MFQTSRKNRAATRRPTNISSTPQYRLAVVSGSVALTLILASCGGSSSTQDATGETVAASDAATDGAGLRLVSAEDAAGIIDSPPENLVILDVRTSEEFAEGHIEGAIMLDFYRDDFADELAKLDPSVPYVLYCRSGNRSGQTIALMEGLGFADVADVDGGIGGWLGAGLPVVVP